MSLFEIPQVRYKALKVSNNYSLPPTLKCIGRKAFLPIPDPGCPAKITGKDNPGRPECMPRPSNIGQKRPTHQSLMNHAFWQDAFMSWAGPWGLLLPSPIESSSKEPHQGWESWREGMLNESTKETTQTPMLERRPATSPEDLAALSVEESDVPVTACREPTAELTRGQAASPTPLETDKKVRESPPCELPSWTQIHSSCPVTPVGQVPLSLSDIRWHHLSHSSSRRRAQCCQIEEQRKSGQGNSSSTSSCRSPMPDPSLEDPPKKPPPGFGRLFDLWQEVDPHKLPLRFLQSWCHMVCWEDPPWPCWH